MRRTAKNRAGAIFHQHKIGDMYRQSDAAIERVYRPQTGVKPLFFGRFNSRLGCAKLGAFGNKISSIRIVFSYFPGDWMVRCHGNERGAKQSVWPGGKDLDMRGVRICRIG